jgi:hypothetical protein
MKRGWWKFSWECVNDSKLTELNDSDLQYIADMILQGYTEGEILQEDDEPDYISEDTREYLRYRDDGGSEQ